jgi:hypothetical protein
MNQFRPENFLVWKKSSASGTGNCVEVAAEEKMVHVRNSKDRSGPVVSFSRAEWEAFLAGVCAGEFS